MCVTLFLGMDQNLVLSTAVNLFIHNLKSTIFDKVNFKHFVKVSIMIYFQTFCMYFFVCSPKYAVTQIKKKIFDRNPHVSKFALVVSTNAFPTITGTFYCSI